MHERRAGMFFIAQGLIGLGWWVLLFSCVSVRDWFVAPEGWLVARSIAIADVIGFGLGSLAVGVGALRGRAWARQAAVAELVVVGYATLVAVSWVLVPVHSWLGLLFMLLSLAGTSIATLALHRS